MTGLVLLAAGASTRLGKPKQQLLYKQQTLLQRATKAALSSVCKPVVVVLGAKAAEFIPDIEDQPVSIVQNKHWEQGMASSISCGLKKILAIAPDVSACMFMVCDQPFVDAALLDSLVEVKKKNNTKIVACSYADTVGTPVLFDQAYFSELLGLTGQQGAKKLLYKYKQEVLQMPFSFGAVDIDTAADYGSLLNMTSQT